MRGEASSDVFKVWLYAAASVFLGAWMTPLFYNAGKALAEVASAKQTNGPLEWLAGICRAAEFPRFFEAALVVAAVVLFVPFMEWLRGGRGGEGRSPWSLRLPPGARVVDAGQPLRRNSRGSRQFATGFLLASGWFVLLAAALAAAGVFDWNAPAEGLSRVIVKSLGLALGLALFQEILFRGIAMGIFLRAMRPTAALGMSAVLFAAVHFIVPPPGLTVPDPEAAGVGFALLRKIGGQFLEPGVVLGVITPLLAIGCVLGYARWRTASLHLPVGLHAGWIFVTGVLAEISAGPSRPDAVIQVIAGRSLDQGLVALAGIVVAGVLAIHLTSDGHASDTPA